MEHQPWGLAMPDLDRRAIETWAAEQEPFLLGAFTSDLLEDDRPSALASLAHLGRSLDRISAADLSAVFRQGGVKERFRELLSHLSLPRRMRILSWVASSLEVSDRHKIMQGLLGGDEGGDILGESVCWAHRGALLRQIFSASRIALLAKACDLSGGLAS